MALKTIRRLASSITNAGGTRIKILDQAKAKEALTRDDVRSLIKQGIIVVEQKKGVGRDKARFKQSRKQAGRRRGVGSKMGSKFAGTSRKDLWVVKVRSQRVLLKSLKPKLQKGAYRELYSRIKGNYFRNKKHLISYLNENKLLTK